MTTATEIDDLIIRARAAGAKISTYNDAAGLLMLVEVRGVRGIGPGAMPIVEATERLREFLSQPKETP